MSDTDDHRPTLPASWDFSGGSLPSTETDEALANELLNSVSGIAASVAASGGVPSLQPFLGIDAEGRWKFGPDATEVERGSEWVANPRSFQHGWIAWPGQEVRDRKPLGEHMVPASQPLPDVATLQPGLNWTNQWSVEMRCISGKDNGECVLYKNGSLGTKAAMQGLTQAFRRQAALDRSRMIPVITLEIDSYENKTWKKRIYNPILRITRWLSVEEFMRLANGGPSGAPATPLRSVDTSDEPPPAAPAGRARSGRLRNVGQTA